MVNKFCTFFLIFVSFHLDAQSKLVGNILSRDSEEKVEMASVLLLDGRDTTKVVQLTIADLNGHFVFDTVAFGVYFLQVEQLSFLAVRKKIEIDSVVGSVTIFMDRDTTPLSEVTVTASNTKWYSDKTAYVITNTERKVKVNALELLATVPQIDVDIVQRTVKTISQGKVKILLNGKNATVDDIITLSKKNILRIDYYNMPQMRYSMEGYESVIDVVTQEIPKGWRMGLALENAFVTGYGRDNISFGLNMGLFYADVKYGLAYHHRKKWMMDEMLSYKIDNENYQREKKGTSGQDTMKMQTLNIGVGLFKNNKYDIYLKYTPSYYHTGMSYAQEVLFNSTLLSEKRFLKKRRAYLQRHHTVDLYLSKKLWDKNDFSANFLYSAYDNNSMSTSIERDELENITLSLPYQSRSKKWTIISELYYTQVFEKWKLNIGGKSTLSGLNLLELADRNRERISSHFGFVEGIGEIKKIAYQLSLGGVQNSFREEQAEHSFKKIKIYPKITLKYGLKKTSYWKLFYDYRSMNPQFSLLTSTRIKLDDYLWNTGNVTLQPYGIHRMNLIFFSKQKNIFYWTQLAYRRINNAPFLFYQKEGNIILQKPINGEALKTYMMSLSIGGDLFSNKLNLRLYSQVQRTMVENNEVAWARDYFYGSITGTYRYNDFLLKLALATPNRSLSGKTEYVQSESSTLSVFWNKPQYSIGLNYSYIFSDSWGATSKTIQGSIVSRISSNQNFDVGKLLTLSINYNFSKGKLPKIARKKLKNMDLDSGTLK